MTVGDAVVSFLEDEDLTTKNSCLITIQDVKKLPLFTCAGPKEWTGKQYRWKDATSRSRRLTTFVIFNLALIAVIVLLGFGISALKRTTSVSLSALIRLGFGTLDPRSIISWQIESIMGNVLVANIPQMVLSFLYFSYNGLFTCMLLGYEWSQFAHDRKGLRVSGAQAGAQRSTYFLQLPYRFSLPLMTVSAILHWLVSQSIFLVAIDFYHFDGIFHSEEESSSWMSCGYSPIAIITTLILGIIMVCAAVGFGYVKYKPGMNLAGSCSVAVSAACHAEEWDGVDGHTAAKGKLKWGVVGIGPDGIGHCSLSSREVSLPEEGRMYA
jgi:hypothetical protein